MRIEGKKFEFEDTIVWVFVMHSSVEMVTKRLYLQIGAQKKARFFSLMYFCESLCINRISHNYVIPQFLFCIIMPFRTSFHIPFRKLIPPFTLTAKVNDKTDRPTDRPSQQSAIAITRSLRYVHSRVKNTSLGSWM